MRSPKLTPTRSGIIGLIEECVRSGGTDIHLKAPGRPQVRLGERLVPTNHDRLTATDMQGLMMALLELAHEEHHLAALRDARFAVGVDGLGRFRVQAVRQRGSWGIVLHVMATEAPTLGSVGLDPSAALVVEEQSGLVLVGGGRARYPVLAAFVREYNQCVPGHLVSIEDPMDYLHRDLRASVTQREVGQDVNSVYEGLVAALRMDPDAVVVSDIPDSESAEAALRAAEEGLLVIAGIASNDGAEALRAFVRRFPPTREEEAHARVSDVLRAVVSAPRTGPAVYCPVHTDDTGEQYAHEDVA